MVDWEKPRRRVADDYQENLPGNYTRRDGKIR